MTRYLLDTHVLLWWLDDPDLLSETAREAIAAPDNLVIVSVASVWEIAIKATLGKLQAPEDLKEMIEDSGFELIAITYHHAWTVKTLPLFDHKDPFDRLLVAQAKVEGLTLITRDVHLSSYGVPIVEA